MLDDVRGGYWFQTVAQPSAPPLTESLKKFNPKMQALKRILDFTFEQGGLKELSNILNYCIFQILAI